MRTRLLIAVALIVGALAFLAGCEATAERTTESSNGAVTVEVLTHFDGITLYRIGVGPRNVYVAAKGSAPISASWTEQHGKSSSQEQTLTVN